MVVIAGGALEFSRALMRQLRDLSPEELLPSWSHAEYDAAFNPEKVERETLARLKAKYGDE